MSLADLVLYTAVVASAVSAVATLVCLGVVMVRFNRGDRLQSVPAQLLAVPVVCLVGALVACAVT